MNYSNQNQIWRKIQEDIFIVAEIGKNFIQTKEEKSIAEYLANAKKLIAAAKEAGVDAVKFQTHEVEDEQLNIDIVSPHFKGSDRYNWIKRNTEATPLWFWQKLKRYCDDVGLVFFSTPMSRKAAQKLNVVGVPFWKVGSGDVQDYVMLDFMLETKKPIIISTGMVSLTELDEVVRHIQSIGSPLVILYCVSQYPAPREYFNLSTIEYLSEKYPDAVIGFSDHSLGIEIPLMAVRLGAKIIEKHFSFSRNLWGPDHQTSATPEEMERLVKKIRLGDWRTIDPQPYYGKKDKELDGTNNQFRPYFNKSLMAGRDIPAGSTLAKEMIFAMRPKMYAKGLPAEKFREILGRKTKVDLKKYDPINWDNLVI